MSSKDDVREFLISRRALITPQQAGLPDLGQERRVPGLRRWLVDHGQLDVTIGGFAEEAG